jgi:hypothetical protein
MNFFPFEKEALEKRFLYQKATIQDDFDGYEIEAIQDLHMLKNNSTLYLGELL